MATGTLGTAARDYHTRQTHYIGQQIRPDNFGTGVPALKLGTVPGGSAIVRAGVVIRTAFNNDQSVTLGTGSASSQQLNLVAVTSANAVGFIGFTMLSGGSNFYPAADTDVYIKGLSAGTTAATAGTGVAFVEYAPIP
jgi:hypothetical protein